MIGKTGSLAQRSLLPTARFAVVSGTKEYLGFGGSGPPS